MHIYIFEAPVGHPDRALAGRRPLGACSFFRSSLIYLFIIVFIYYGPTQPQEPSPKLLVVCVGPAQPKRARGQPQAIPDRSRGRTRLYAKKKRGSTTFAVRHIDHIDHGPFSLKTAPRAAPFASDMLFTDADLFRCQAGPGPRGRLGGLCSPQGPSTATQLKQSTSCPSPLSSPRRSGDSLLGLGTDLPQY